jgi:uncharacterized protein
MNRWLIALAVALPIAILLIAPHLPAGVRDVCFGPSCVKAELALTDLEHMRGLMGRKSLPPDAGMLFVFDEEGVYPFWMKDTLIPLDMVWLDSNLEVVHIAHALPCTQDPCGVYDPGKRARYVLEVNGGYAQEKGIAVGEKATIRPPL